MNEAIPVSTRKRSDLKPGTVFRYAADTLEKPTLFVVGARHSATPADISYANPSNPSEEGPYSMDGDVVVLWVPPMEKVMGHVRVEQKPDRKTDPKALAPKKPSIHHVPVALSIACAEALDEGAIKYGRAKWRETDTEAMTYLGGALRHLYAYIEGEDIDPESLTGKSHLAGAVASLAILLDCLAAGTLIDNRPKNIGAAKLLRTPEKK